MEGVTGLVRAVDNNEIVLVASTLLKTELIKLDERQMDMFNRFVTRRNVEIKDATGRIMELSGEIRAYYQELRDNNETNLPTLTTPDAIHLATAIYWDCEKFFTFDENDEAGGTRPKRALIPLSGVVAGKYNIEICKPLVSEPGFAF
jgi:predicted nucleic acid-binding protein